MADFHGGVKTALGAGDDDLQEEELWTMMRSTTESSNPKLPRKEAPMTMATPHHAHVNLSSSSSAWRRLSGDSQTTAKIRAAAAAAGTGDGNEPQFAAVTNRVACGHSSAPVDIPDGVKFRNDYSDDEDDAPAAAPHEYVARRRLWNGQTSSFSMCQGAGRTLKGRDLSCVRNAILSKTGFLE